MAIVFDRAKAATLDDKERDRLERKLKCYLKDLHNLNQPTNSMSAGKLKRRNAQKDWLLSRIEQIKKLLGIIPKI